MGDCALAVARGGDRRVACSRGAASARNATAAETRVDIVTPATDQPTSFALSPDGRQIVFVASDDGASRLWLRSLATTTAQPLAGTEGATSPFWSPDSRSRRLLRRRRAEATRPRRRRPADTGSGRTNGGGTWNADGVIVFAPSLTSPLMRVSATGGAAMAVTTLGPQQSVTRWPQFLPDGQRLLFTVGGLGDASGSIWAGSTGVPRPGWRPLTSQECMRLGLVAVGAGGLAVGRNGWTWRRRSRVSR